MAGNNGWGSSRKIACENAIVPHKRIFSNSLFIKLLTFKKKIRIGKAVKCARKVRVPNGTERRDLDGHLSSHSINT
tara:strand:+ start:1451 stop:1678 length:228 start_codon:yes stop_codon:yes gene_type:complete